MKHRPGFVTALLLVTVGVVLYLNNIGLISVSLVDLVPLWPVILVLVAIEMLVTRAETGLVYALGVFWAIVVLVGAGLLAWQAARLRPVEVEAALPRSTLSDDLGTADAADVRIELDTGTLDLGAVGAGGVLAEAVAIGEGAELSKTRTDEGTRARLVLVGRRAGDPWDYLSRFPGDVTWQVELAGVPMGLGIGLGAARAHIDLSELRLSTFDLGTTFPDATVVLPREGAVDAHIQGIAGTITIEVPEGTQARFEIPPRLTNVDVAPGFETWGSGGFQSLLLDESLPHHDVRVELGAGRVLLK